MTTNTNRNTDLISQLHDVQTQRETWENGSYKTSNAELYSILASCLDIYQQLLSNDKRAQRKDLTERLHMLGLKTTENTPLATKIIRYVFKTDRKRSHTYSRVITFAHNEKIDAVRLPKWIADMGGVEEVRRTATSGVSNAQRTENLVSIAEDELAAHKALVPVFNPSAELKPDKEGTRRYSLAVIRAENDGTCSIVYGINNGALLRQVLARAGKELEERRKLSAESQKKSELSNARAIAIAATV